MEQDKLKRALEIAERSLPDSELAKELNKRYRYTKKQQDKKRYIEMITRNEFSSRGEIEELDVAFKDDLLFFYDTGNFKPTEEKAKIEELNELLDILDGEGFSVEKKEVEEQIKIYGFKKRLSEESWDDVVDTISPEDYEGYPKFKNLFKRFDSLLDMVR